jgi:hypothetical protein
LKVKHKDVTDVVCGAVIGSLSQPQAVVAGLTQIERQEGPRVKASGGLEHGNPAGTPNPENSVKYLNRNAHIAPAGVILKMRIQLWGHPGGGLGAPAV